MTLDVEKLRALLAAGSARPWKNDERYPEEVVRCHADSSVSFVADFGRHISDAALAVAAVNALPALLSVYVAACRWADDMKVQDEELMAAVREVRGR